MVVKDYSEYFDIELECWCHGLRNVDDKVDPAVVYKVIKEFTPVLRGAVEKLFVFDVFDTADRLIAASRTTACRKEIAFYLLSQLPAPKELTADQRAVLTKIVKSVEPTYNGALQRLEKKWGSATLKMTAPAESLTLPAKSEGI
jgi:hypothetical protein